MKLMNKKYLWLLPVLIVCAAMVVGVWYAGSPRAARASRIDDQRIQDLGNLQATIDAYWQNEKKLPENLAQVKDTAQKLPPYASISYFVTKDPVSGEDYGYKKVDEDTFEVCATFETE